MNIKEIELKYADLIKKAQDIMKDLDDPVHGIEHMRGVVENTIILLNKQNDADKEVCILSAYWHDVGRKFGKGNHEVKSAEMLGEELKRLNYDGDFIDKCYNAIYKHGEKTIPDTLEGIIVRDADKLDYFGIRRWNECIKRNVRLPRIFLGLKDKLLLLDYSKELYNTRVQEWLDFLREITLDK